jgi:hypothetical protein
MEGYCSTGQSPQWAVVPMEEEEELLLLLPNHVHLNSSLIICQLSRNVL